MAWIALLFAGLLEVGWLGEAVTLVRLGSIALIVAGLVGLKLSA